MNRPAAAAARNAATAGILSAKDASKTNYARLAGRKKKTTMESTKIPPTPAPSSCPPPSASGAPGGNGVATATGTLPRENGREHERTVQRVQIPGQPILRFTQIGRAQV